MVTTFLRNSYWGRAKALTLLRKHDAADADWDRALALSPAAQRLDFGLDRAYARAYAGDYLRAARDAEEFVAMPNLDGVSLYNLACVQALNARHAVADATRPLPEREKRAENCARGALVLLKRAAKASYFRDPKTVEHVTKDEDLASLRQRDDFRAFVASLKPR
jgi:hypothetical protein